ncbi:ATP synthase A1 subunit C [Methanimicrococcus blatticola]|uniref:A-type ATP synthase subunit C n=1 Tax=Methanimicrococcus blatticola TaxID=91560 RepID=A0A484F2H6_9EURY|nr:ATP synthase A1 subunit C [Methanimicrococcus blatticola]MBZ3935396.1 ATP synthase A1 subunit C [Methanimicrococcus blatticola]MCC2508506.1 ATP synthase A1 subunit C [Methanimicrococcus blatticola]TDQ67815.1 V/A-type H+-transporting ATPase subunit C [Methanimicrococcus blatticola]
MLNTQKIREISEYVQDQLPDSVSKHIPSRLPAFGKGSSNYPYAVTRIRAMRVKLFPRDAYPRFLNMSLDEITRKIGESEYKQDIDELSREYTGVNLIEHALNRNMAESSQKVLRITEGEPHELVREYLRVFDIDDIKTILRGKLHNIPEDQILQALVTGGALRYTFLSGLVTKNVDEIIASFSDSPYGPILKRFDGTNFPEIENELDKFYYENLFEAIGLPSSADRKQFDQFVRREIDIKNLSLLLRVKKYEALENAESEGTQCIIEDVSSMMIPHGLALDTDKLKSLCYDDFIEALRLTPYWDVISAVLENADLKSVSLTDVEARLTRFNLTKVTENSRRFLISIIPILEFIIYKSNEVRNLRIIIRGKSVGMDNELIKDRLVIL